MTSSKYLRSLLALTLCATLLSGCDGSPPKKEIDEAVAARGSYTILNSYSRKIADETVYFYEIEETQPEGNKFHWTYQFVKRGKLWYHTHDSR